MRFNWKQALGSVALSAMALGMIGVDVAEAKKGQKNDVIKPNPDTAAEIETGQMLDKGKPRPPSVEKGIKDPGVKSCNGCGMTGREAAPPATGEGTAPAPSVDIETGQMLDKGPRWKPSATERRANSGPGGTPPSTAKKGRPKERDDSPHNRSSLLPVLGGVAALAALVAAVGGGSDKPTSP